MVVLAEVFFQLLLILKISSFMLCNSIIFQADLDNLDYETFPKLRNLHGVQAVIGPGDVLYIPIYWWHYIESVKPEKYSVSLNFWYKVWL